VRHQTKLILSPILSTILICTLLWSCSKKNNEVTTIIEGGLVPENYHYNPFGFINTPYGRVSITTQSYYKNEKLFNLSWNRANGFLEYDMEDLRNDPKLYQSFNVDSLFSKNNEKIINYNTKSIRNDTIFYKENEKIIIIRQP